MTKPINEYRTKLRATFKDDAHIAVAVFKQDLTVAHVKYDLSCICDDLDMQKCYDYVKGRIPAPLFINQVSYYCIGSHVMLADFDLREFSGVDVCIERGCHQWELIDGVVKCRYCGEVAMDSTAAKNAAVETGGAK